MINWDNVNLPSGVCREKIWNDILNIAKIKANQHSAITKFWFTKEDLEQEIIIKCIKALSKYNPKKSFEQKYTLYFSRCADNIVMDIKRKHIYHYQPPCKTCRFWNKENNKNGEHDCEEFFDKGKCPLYKEYLINSKSKFSLGTSHGSYYESAPSSKDGDSLNDTSGFFREVTNSGIYIDNFFNSLDLDEHLEFNLSTRAYKIYKDITENNFNVNKITKEDFDFLKLELKYLYDKTEEDE